MKPITVNRIKQKHDKPAKGMVL